MTQGQQQSRGARRAVMSLSNHLIITDKKTNNPTFCMSITQLFLFNIKIIYTVYWYNNVYFPQQTQQIIDLSRTLNIILMQILSVSLVSFCLVGYYAGFNGMENNNNNSLRHLAYDFQDVFFFFLHRTGLDES